MNLMLIRYCDDSQSLEVAASSQGFLELSKQIMENGAEIKSKVLDSTKAAPYSRFLSGIQVKFIPNQLLEFQVVGDKLVLQGDPEHILVFYKNIYDFGRHWKLNYHIHVEYFPGHYYLSPNSLAFVITCRED